MKLKKDKWEVAELNKIVHVVNGSTPKEIETANISGEFPFLRVSDMNLEGNEIYINKWNISLSQSDINKFKVKLYPKNTIIFPKRGASIHTNKKRILLKECGIDLNTMGFVAGDKIDFYYLFTWFQTIDLKTISDGSYIPQINSRNIEGIQIPLPPLEEQKQIAALFQSMETAMEQVEGQEKNLKVLWKRLIDEFVSDKPSFGNLLEGKKLQTYNYCDVTDKLMRKIDPLTYGIERIVGGENLESEDFKIRTWQKVGEGYLGPAFHVLFKSGDILYGSRRTYLRKVSYADFDGVCANTTYVIRANENFLLQDLLKHIMLSEKFTQYSIGVSKGSTNPYINWKDLDNFSIKIPDIETQREIANVLDGILQIVEQLKQQKTTLKQLKQKLLNEILG